MQSLSPDHSATHPTQIKESYAMMADDTDADTSTAQQHPNPSAPSSDADTIPPALSSARNDSKYNIDAASAEKRVLQAELELSRRLDAELWQQAIAGLKDSRPAEVQQPPNTHGPVALTRQG